MRNLPTKSDFWFLPLGGAGEIGMNLNLYGHNQQWLMVDLGITFHDRLGVEVITPDPSFILPYQNNLKGLVLTHAHEDHVGAIPYLWHYLRCPIYATPFTAAVVRQKISEKPWADQVEIIEIPLSGTIKVGHFKVEFITITHSIAEPNVLAITTPLGTVVHTGDWKIDPHPLIGQPTDYKRLQELGDQGVLTLVCDSTNALTEGISGSEQEVRDELDRLISDYPDHRLTVACFASNIARLETVALAAASQGRRVALIGRSLHRMVAAAAYAGYLKKLPAFISDQEAVDLPHNKVLFITTGSQGEARSALARIANLQHSFVKMGPQDVVFFSSRVIPGNEKHIGVVQNRLVQAGVTIITSQEEDIHVSGHPARDELRQMYKWIRPQAAIPVHGEMRHLTAHAELAKEQGVKHVKVIQNGSLVQLNPSPEVIEQVAIGRWGLDGKRLVPMVSPVLRERHKLSIQGVIFITLGVSYLGEITRLPQYTILGVHQGEEEYQELVIAMNHLIHNTVIGDFKSEEKNYLESLKQAVRHVVNQRFGKKPVVEIHLIKD
jgi:ribonuclease J